MAEKKIKPVSNLQALILNMLVAGKNRYGLEMVKASRGKLKRGTIYVLLDRLEQSGLVESKLKKNAKGEKGPQRRVYSITGAGRRALAQKTSYLKVVLEGLS